MKLSQFLKEDNGQYSSIRLFAFMVVGCFCAEWIKSIVLGIPFNPSWTEVGVVFGALGIKATQKFTEVKGETTLNTQ